MPTVKPRSSRGSAASESSAGVDAFMSTLVHPHKSEIEALRQVICGADATVLEGVKWNAPSFRTTEYFATTHLRAKAGVGLILHLGAKVRDIASIPIDDPQGLLKWIAKDRAMFIFATSAELQARQSALASIVRQWITYV